MTANETPRQDTAPLAGPPRISLCIIFFVGIMVLLNIILIFLNRGLFSFLYPNVLAFSILLFIAASMGETVDRWLQRKVLRLWSRSIKAGLFEICEDRSDSDS